MTTNTSVLICLEIFISFGTSKLMAVKRKLSINLSKSEVKNLKDSFLMTSTERLIKGGHLQART